MPTVVRFLTIIAVLVACVYAAMFGLVMMVQPEKREMTVDVPLDQIKPAPERTGSTPGEQAPGQQPRATPPSGTGQ